MPEYSDFIKTPTYGCLIDEQKVKINSSINQVLQRIWTVGGENGWYYANWLWKIRGFLDKIAGGVGLRRGRRDQYDCHAAAFQSQDYGRHVL